MKLAFFVRDLVVVFIGFFGFVFFFWFCVFEVGVIIFLWKEIGGRFEKDLCILEIKL